jgi:hypothetical protein
MRGNQQAGFLHGGRWIFECIGQVYARPVLSCRAVLDLPFMPAVFGVPSSFVKAVVSFLNKF